MHRIWIWQGGLKFKIRKGTGGFTFERTRVLQGLQAGFVLTKSALYSEGALKPGNWVCVIKRLSGPMFIPRSGEKVKGKRQGTLIVLVYKSNSVMICRLDSFMKFEAMFRPYNVAR